MLRICIAFLVTFSALCAQWQAPQAERVVAPVRSAGPVVVATEAEVTNLRTAYKRKLGPVVGLVSRAGKGLSGEVRYPPRGGQHNQWYQCDDCQLALKTVDETHHRCPKCEKVYSGAPYDDVIYSRVHSHNLRRMRDAAWAFAITEDRRFLEFARSILLGYADRYEGYPHHGNDRRGRSRKSGGHLKEQTLSEASMFIGTIAPAVDLLWGDLDEAERTHVLEHLVRPILVNLDRHRAGKSNWQSFHNAAMLVGGALLGDVEWMRKALFQKGNGFLFQMENCVSQEGMWFENSWSYHFYTLGALTGTVEAARRLGIDLWHHPRLAAMYSLAPQYLMSDGTLPRFGDALTTPLRSRGEQLEAAWAVLRRPDIGRALPRKLTWSGVMRGRFVSVPRNDVELRSTVIKGAGHAILRNSGDSRLSAALTFGPFGGFHGHFDKLSFVFFAHGEELGLDPGRSRSQAYRLPIHRNWYRASVAHNTIVVDGKSQKGTSGKLLTFVDKEDWSAVVAECRGAYPGVVHTRLLLLASDYLIVLDSLISKEEHEYNWMYHNRGMRVTAEGLTTSPQRLAGQGWEFIEPRQQGLVKDTVAVQFEHEDVTTRVWADAGDALVTLGDGPFESVVIRAALMSLTKTGKSVRFATVLEPTQGSEEPKILALRVEGKVLHLTRTDGVESLTWDGARSIRYR